MGDYGTLDVVIKAMNAWAIDGLVRDSAAELERLGSGALFDAENPPFDYHDEEPWAESISAHMAPPDLPWIRYADDELRARIDIKWGSTAHTDLVLMNISEAASLCAKIFVVEHYYGEDHVITATQFRGGRILTRSRIVTSAPDFCDGWVPWTG